MFRGAAAIGAAYIVSVWFTETVVRHEAVLRVTVDGARYWGVARGPVMVVFVPFMLGAAVYCIAVLARARDMERFERRLLLVAFGFYLAVGIAQQSLQNRLTSRVVMEFAAFGVLALALIILFAPRI